MNDQKLEALFIAPASIQQTQGGPRCAAFLSQIDYFKVELKRIGVTRKLLWQEYTNGCSGGYYGYTQFCELLRRELAIGKATLLQPSGDPLYYTDRETGELIPCPVLVGVLPFSGYGKPRDKPTVENAVHLLYMRVYARLKTCEIFLPGWWPMPGLPNKTSSIP